MFAEYFKDRKYQIFNKNGKSRSGFTLLELLISISIMALLFTAGYANYRDFQRRQHLESAVTSVRGDLRFAQGLALSGRKPAGCSSLNGYMFRRRNDSQYRIEAVCNNGQTCNGNSDFCFKTVDLPQGVTINNLNGAGGNSFYFKVLGRGLSRANGNDISGDVTITLNFPDSGVSSQTVVVTSGGEIK